MNGNKLYSEVITIDPSDIQAKQPKHNYKDKFIDEEYLETVGDRETVRRVKMGYKLEDI
jgi:hypothetical protein